LVPGHGGTVFCMAGQIIAYEGLAFRTSVFCQIAYTMDHSFVGVNVVSLHYFITEVAGPQQVTFDTTTLHFKIKNQNFFFCRFFNLILLFFNLFLALKLNLA
jgi:hypothetical protein